MVMKREMFITLFKDLISHLYDVTVIETHPLSQHFPIDKISDSSTCRAEAIQKLILQEIELLRPPGKEPQPQSPEWRPYLILHKRYVLGESPRDIASALYIGDRQFRRDHSRALQALSSRIWERYFISGAVDATIEPSSNSEDDFILHLERLDLSEVVKSLEGILVQRFRTERLRLDLKIPSRPITVSADRVLLRQILLSLVNYGLQLCAGNSLGLWLESQPDRNVIHINFETDEQWELNREEGKDLLNYVRSWAQRMNVQIDERYPLPGQKGNVSLRLMFASVQHRIILIVDDQVTALRMFERYLSHTGIEVIGITNPEQTLEVARKVQPNLIILDVMMPRLDGWEVLQALQLNPKTSKIPILVCSAWDEPELAYSLGAAAFLKKPILQRQLLDVLYQLNLLD
jgi:CheY-like chemotaxis protein